MKTEKNNFSEKSRPGRRHPVRQKLLSALLCVCLLLASLPIEFYGFKVQAEEPGKQILSFSDLSQEIKYQTLEPGTSLEELNLPETLEAVCIPLETEPAGSPADSVQLEQGVEMQGADLEQKSESGEAKAPEQESEADTAKAPEPESGTAEIPESEPETPEPETGGSETPEPEAGEPETSEPEPGASEAPEPEAGEPEMPEPEAGEPEIPESEAGVNTSLEETVIIENITWTSAPSYDPKTEGVYVFTPVLPKQYVPAKGVSLPEIQVTVKKAEGSRGEGESQEPADQRRRAGSRAAEETEEIKEYDIKPGNRESLISPVSGDIVITGDTSWTRRTLSGGNLVIEEGATLTLNGSLDISGNVTIQGGGTIARGNKDVVIDVAQDAALTMRGITVDGKGLEASYAMIRVRGALKVEAGCKIQNCHTRGYSRPGFVTGYGGAVYLFWASRARAELLDCTISDCTASYGGAAFCSGSCTLTLDNGCRIENCGAVRRIGDDAAGANGNGGAIVTEYNNASVKLLNCTISHCSAEGDGGAIICGSMNVTLGKDCVIENCSASNNGGAVALWGQTEADFQGCVISRCSAKGCGGAVYCNSSTVRINEDCKIQWCSARKGGVFYNQSSKLYVNGGQFSRNTAINSGGAIFHSNAAGTETYLSGGTFQENKCYTEKYKGSGGACLSSEGAAAYETHFEMSGDVRFGGGIDSSADGIYLDSQNEMPRKIIVSEALSAPVMVYLEAAEHYVIAKGTESCRLTEEDRKKISFVDVGESGGKWILKLDEEENEIYLTREYKILSADFYSGGPEPSEPLREERKVEESVIEEPIKAPLLRDFPDWEPLGWNENPSEYTAGIGMDGTCALTETAGKYYGIYQRETTLSYDAGEGTQGPAPVSKPCYANVHEEEIGYQKAVFTIEDGPAREGYEFLGWSMVRAEGQTSLYQPGDTLETKDDIVLYAVYREKGKRTFLANFHSGDPVRIRTEMAAEEETAQEGTVTAPLLEEFSGWEPLGWSVSKTGHEVSLLEQGTCTLREPLTEYYGIYRKNITLTYDSNGGNTVPDPETKPGYANVHQEAVQEFPEFTFAPAIRREGYVFAGWSADPDGEGTLYEAGAAGTLKQDTLLYAVWEEVFDGPKTASYRVEHYCQNLTGEDYARMDDDTEDFTGTAGEEVQAQPKTYTGFTVNLSHPSGKSKGKVEEDGSLVLKLYYDRNIYEVDFDLNGGQGTAPASQKIRYGGFLEQVPQPLRIGYNFKGWYLDEKGLAGDLWDFDSPVENNTGELRATLYAGWADELAPALGEAAFGKGYRNFLDWIIQRQTMVITVPVTEEGSGLAKAEYLLASEDGTQKDGEAQFWETHALSDTMASYGTSAVLIRGMLKQADHGKYEVRFAVEEEFKGKVYLTCTDYAGNVSARKTLTAKEGGIIVEDNAPEIHFSNTKETAGGKPLEVKVTVKDDMEDHVTGGISRIRFKVDGGKEKTLPEEDFAEDFVKEYDFTVKIKEEGKHTLRVEAADHAGNESAAEITLKINGKKDVPAKIPDNPTPGGPKGGEPKTGEGPRVQVYATTAMIAGFSYLLFYFQGENGITEQEKEEIIYRLVSWAKQGGSIRRILGLAVIFLFLAYYHSIGKSVSLEWKEVYGK